MPKALEPGKTFPIVLPADKDKNPRPTFWAKTQSMRGHQEIFEVLDLSGKLGQEMTAEDLFTMTVEKLAEIIPKWTGMVDAEGKEIPYSKDGFRDLLDYYEARELLQLAAYNHHVNDEEKKSTE